MWAMPSSISEHPAPLTGSTRNSTGRRRSNASLALAVPRWPRCLSQECKGVTRTWRTCATRNLWRNFMTGQIGSRYSSMNPARKFRFQKLFQVTRSGAKSLRPLRLPPTFLRQPQQGTCDLRLPSRLSSHRFPCRRLLHQHLLRCCRVPLLIPFSCSRAFPCLTHGTSLLILSKVNMELPSTSSSCQTMPKVKAIVAMPSSISARVTPRSSSKRTSWERR
mmetsp:Transcript_25062/g.59633  ORF Transcript_25062/g.59633 Transcript_25062/m.59633 type:complete len:220 (-) Transcript_25062:1291-1950(-)